MSRGPRRTARGDLLAHQKSLRAPTGLPDNTEKLVSSSMRHPEADQTRRHSLLPTPQPVPHHDYSAHPITNVLAPIPDTSLSSSSADSATLTTSSFLVSQTSGASNTTPTGRHATPKTTFMPLPYLKTDNLTEIKEAARSSSAVRPTPTVRPVAVTTPISDSDHRNSQPNTSRLSTTGIIALAVSVSLTFFIAIGLVKLIKWPRRRRTPTPSLPILHEGTSPHDERESEDSPMFGGKECSSPILQSRNTGLWTWTQYNSGIPKPAPAVTATRSGPQDQLLNVTRTTQQDSHDGVDSNVTCAQGQDQSEYPFVGYGSSNATSKSKSLITVQPVQNTITRTVSRLSTGSISLYPNSLGGKPQVGADVGPALDGVTHDIAQVDVAELKYKDRTMASRNGTNMLAPVSGGKDGAALRSESQRTAYGGMVPTSRPIVSPSRVKMNGGRARIKSTYYTSGSYPRASAAAATIHRQHEVDDEHDGINQEQNKAQGADSRRGRGLTSALGLTSPIPTSPQPTLYPDDSMSVIGEAKKVILTRCSQKKPDPKTSCDSPSTDTAALGNLMMVDSTASKSTGSLVNIRPCERTMEDKPLRVPPPSLADDTDGYGEYHSPTYSICGLYDGDGKYGY